MRALESKLLAAATRLVVFRSAEIARLVGVAPAVVSRTLGQLERAHHVTRVVRGVWAVSKHPRFSPYIVVPYLVDADPERAKCYVSFVSALSLHGMISQIPGAIHVAVQQQRRPLLTSVGQYRFHQIDRPLFDGHEAGDAYGRFHVANPTKALFDTLYVAAGRGRRFAHLPEVELPKSVTDVAMQRWISRITSPIVSSAVNARWQAVRVTARRMV
jgi:predicted transcriptional regulator of viral defense system